MFRFFCFSFFFGGGVGGGGGGGRGVILRLSELSGVCVLGFGCSGFTVGMPGPSSLDKHMGFRV